MWRQLLTREESLGWLEAAHFAASCAPTPEPGAREDDDDDDKNAAVAAAVLALPPLPPPPPLLHWRAAAALGRQQFLLRQRAHSEQWVHMPPHRRRTGGVSDASDGMTASRPRPLSLPAIGDVEEEEDEEGAKDDDHFFGGWQGLIADSHKLAAKQKEERGPRGRRRAHLDPPKPLQMLPLPLQVRNNNNTNNNRRIVLLPRPPTALLVHARCWKSGGLCLGPTTTTASRRTMPPPPPLALLSTLA